jgi:hypothetical protein
MEDTLPTASERVTELVARLQARFGRKDGEKDGEEAEALRYVIYVRKSTDTAEKQERSIGDQTAECKTLADRLGLRWVDVIHEEQPVMTPKFHAMLNELKEDGEITDMLAPVRAERNTSVVSSRLGGCFFTRFLTDTLSKDDHP